LITHFCLLDLDYPLNLLKFFGDLFPIIAFDILPEGWYEKMFNLSELEDESISDQFEIVGYENTSLVYGNLGSLLIYIFSIPASYLLITFLLHKPCEKIRDSSLIKNIGC
jgi:hypothetical protein